MADDDETEAAAKINRLEAERDKLQRFKDWVHTYLDSKGVPHHPPGTHGAEGCRIGDRMDWVWAEHGRLLALCREAAAALGPFADFSGRWAVGWRDDLKVDSYHTGGPNVTLGDCRRAAAARAGLLGAAGEGQG